MKKIPMLLAMTFDDKGNRVITNEVSEKARFLLDHPDAVATWKRDGTAVKLNEDGEWFARRTVKKGKSAPAGFILEEFDPVTGHSFGWEPIEGSAFRKMWKRAVEGEDFAPGTFELIGPKINGDPEKIGKDTLIRHGSEIIEDFPTIDEIKEHEDDVIGFLLPFFTDFRARGIEGIVWWVDGVPAVKLRAKDFFPDMDSRFRR